MTAPVMPYPDDAQALWLSVAQADENSQEAEPHWTDSQKEVLALATGEDVPVRRWLPNTPKEATVPAVVLFVHGLSGTTMWLSRLATPLVAAGLTVVGLEMPEIGVNPEGVGDFTEREELIHRVASTVEALHEIYQAPVWVMGLSLGGLLTAHAAAKKPQGLAGVALVSPAFKASPATFEPSFYLKAVVRRIGENLGVVKPGKTMPIPFASDQTTITRCQDKIDLMNQTPNRVLSLTARAAVQLILLTLFDTPGVIPKIDCPVRLYVSTDDRICDAPTMYAQFQRLASTDKQLVVFPEARHDVTLEPELPLLARHLLAAILGSSDLSSPNPTEISSQPSPNGQPVS